EWAGHELASPCSPGIGYRQGEQRGQAGGLHRLQERSGLRIGRCHLAPAFAGPAAGWALRSSQPRNRRVITGTMTQVMAATISPLKTSARSAIGHPPITGPPMVSTSRTTA